MSVDSNGNVECYNHNRITSEIYGKVTQLLRFLHAVACDTNGINFA